MAVRFGLPATLEAQNGKGEALAALLQQGRAIAAEESGTVTWYAFPLEFALARVSYEALRVTFWQIHDPTQIGRQGFDIGEQYRSAVFTHSSEQARLALDSRAEEQRLRTRPISTEVAPAGPFYLAEPYHQRFYEREGGSAPGRHALSDLTNRLALADPDDASNRNGVVRESRDSRRQ